MAREDQRIQVSTAVAVRGASGFFFGTLRWIEPDRLCVEIDTELAQGDRVDVRITLAPTTSTALVNALVARPLVTAQGESPRYVLGIERAAPDERALLDDWMANVGQHGTFSTFRTLLPSSDRPAARSNEEVRRALAQMARRPLGDKPLSDAFDLQSDLVTGSTSGAGRGAMRDALRGAISRGTAGRVVARTPEPTGSVAAPHAPAAAPAPPAPRTPPATPRPPEPASGGAADPTYGVTRTRDAQWMEVRWHAPAAFADACRLHLANHMLVLRRGADPLPDQAPIRMMLRHAGFHAECAAVVLAHTAGAASYRLELDVLQVERIQQWALDYGKK